MKDHVEKVKSHGLADRTSQERFLKEEGGVQIYVIWLGAILMLFGMFFSEQFVQMYGDGMPPEQIEETPTGTRGFN